MCTNKKDQSVYSYFEFSTRVGEKSCLIYRKGWYMCVLRDGRTCQEERKRAGFDGQEKRV